MRSGKQRRDPSTTLPELIERARRAIARSSQTAADCSNSILPRGAGFEFLILEADTGSTFARIALDAIGNHEKVRRNTPNARRAYDTILRFKGRLQLGPVEAAELMAKVELLRGQLQKLTQYHVPAD